MKKLITPIILCLFSVEAFSQGVAINETSSSPDASSILDVSSTDKGILIPRMTTAQRTAIASPATGLLVYDTSLSSFYVYDGSWNALSTSGLNWELSGNAGTTNGTDFIGTTDAQSLDIRTNNSLRTRITQKGQIETLNTGQSVFIGEGAGASDDLSNNQVVFLGYNAGNANTTGHSNIGIGYEALVTNTTGGFNVAIGNSALGLNTSGSYNIAMGLSALRENTTGQRNIAIGRDVLEYNTTGSDNCLIGYQIMAGSSSARYNSVLGSYSLAGSSGEYNAVLGYNSGSNNTTGSNNTIIGSEAGNTNSTGNNNTFIGYNSDATINNLINATAIGANASVSQNNSLILGNSANVGIGTSTPDDELDVVGNAQISGYIKVGNPSTPQSISPEGVQLYEMDAGSYYNGFTQSGCGTQWVGTTIGTTLQDRSALQWDNMGTARSHRYLFSPWIWVPSNVTTVTVELNHYCTLENTFDGVYIEYSTDGSTWTTVSNATFYLGGYNGSTAGSDNACSSNANVDAWTGTQNNIVTAFPLTISNTWVQFRFVAMEDNLVGTGIYYLFNFGVWSDYSGNSYGGSFNSGNIYAENNIYAGSNVLLGDLAEYFPVAGSCSPGDIISMSSGNNNLFTRSSETNDTKMIGIYSSNPTLTLNDPNSGIPVALQGRVPINVIGKIQKGDYLTSSHIPGKAMKATEPCFIVGRALENFDSEEGQVICLVKTGWYQPRKELANSGSFRIKKNEDEVKVFDSAIKKDSKVFVSMRGNTGTNHWVDIPKNGSFILHLANRSINDVLFDYFIENAKNRPAKIKHSKKIVRDQEVIKSEKNVNAPDINMYTQSNEENIIPEYDGSLPPTVPDKAKPYYWSSKSGIVPSSEKH